MKRIIHKIISAGVTLFLLFTPVLLSTASVHAQVLNTDPTNTRLNVPVNNPDSSTIQTALKYLFAVAALLSVVFVAIGGFKYTVSAGDSQSTQSAKNTILYAVIGLAVSILAFVIVQFVVSQL
jgi:hypothetical protein